MNTRKKAAQAKADTLKIAADSPEKPTDENLLNIHDLRRAICTVFYGYAWRQGQQNLGRPDEIFEMIFADLALAPKSKRHQVCSLFQFWVPPQYIFLMVEIMDQFQQHQNILDSVSTVFPQIFEHNWNLDTKDTERLELFTSVWKIFFGRRKFQLKDFDTWQKQRQLLATIKTPERLSAFLMFCMLDYNVVREITAQIEKGYVSSHVWYSQPQDKACPARKLVNYLIADYKLLR